jgi:hypothetical protein
VGSYIGEEGTADCGSFEEAVRAIRGKHPGVSFRDHWHEWPPAGNGDKLAELPFGLEKKGGVLTLGHLSHIRAEDVD